MLLPARRMVHAICLVMKVGRMSSFSLYPVRHKSSHGPARSHLLCVSEAHKTILEPVLAEPAQQIKLGLADCYGSK